MIAGELGQELRTRYPAESLVHNFEATPEAVLTAS